MAVVPIYILAGQSNASGTGLDAELMNALAANGPSFELVKFAVGGTGLAKNSAERGDWSVNSEGELYDQLVASVLARIEYVIAQGDTPVIAGMFWVQGEHDSNSQATAEAYATNLTEFITSLREDLNSDFQFIFSGLSGNLTRAHADTVREGQQHVAETVPNTTLLDTTHLQFLPDNLHYNAVARDELAHMMVEAVDNVVQADAEGYVPNSGLQYLSTTNEDDVINLTNDFRDYIISSGGGDDTIRSGSGDNIVVAGSGNDTVLTRLGNDVIVGGDGDDIINASWGYAALLGPYDPNNPWVGFDNDFIDAGAGNDRIVDMVGNNTIEAGEGNDSIVTGYGDDFIRGDLGDDVIKSGAGDDLVYGGAGHDRISGGDGIDVLFGDSGDDTISGENGSDFIYGGSGNDRIWGGDGDDRIEGNHGNDRISGGNGADTIYGGQGDDVIHGGADDDVLSGGSGDDRIDGGDGNDIVSGGWGNDVVYGGNGDDRLSDSFGDDTLYGGSGADLFTFGGITALRDIDRVVTGYRFNDLGDNTIMDFQVGVDHLKLANIFNGGQMVKSLDKLLTMLTEDLHGNAVLNTDNGSITFNGVGAQELMSNPSSITLGGNEALIPLLVNPLDTTH